MRIKLLKIAAGRHRFACAAGRPSALSPAGLPLHSCTMFRRLTAILLSVVLSLYGFSAVAQALSMGGDLQHAVAHLEKVAHHHHDDGSFHADDSEEAVQHVQVDNWLSTPAVPMGDLTLRHVLVSATTPQVAHATARPPPFLQGLRRPPRSILA